MILLQPCASKIYRLDLSDLRGGQTLKIRIDIKFNLDIRTIFNMGLISFRSICYPYSHGQRNSECCVKDLETRGREAGLSLGATETQHFQGQMREFDSEKNTRVRQTA